MKKVLIEAAKAYYNLYPNGYYKWDYVSTASDAKREKVFHPDNWEDAPGRHEKCIEEVKILITTYLQSLLQEGKIAIDLEEHLKRLNDKI